MPLSGRAGQPTLTLSAEGGGDGFLSGRDEQPYFLIDVLPLTG